MPIVGGLDIHRKQLTFDYPGTVTGEVRRGQVAPADREHLRAWLARFAGRDDVAFAMEGCTGWRYVAEELAAAGIAAHVGRASRHRRGPRPQAACQDRQDRLPAPEGPAGRGPAAGVLDPAGADPGVPGAAGDLSRPAPRAHRLGAAARCSSTRAPRGWARARCAPRQGLAALRAAAAAHLSPAGQLQVATALDMLAAPEARMEVLRTQLRGAARHLTGAKVLAARLYGAGPVTALALTCWLAGEGRFSSSRKAVRFTGLDITVWSSDGKGPPGRLSRQGPPVLRWAVYEAGKTHARASAPDHACYAAVKDRKNSKRAALPRPARSSGRPATS